jgi:hypothetical protein
MRIKRLLKRLFGFTSAVFAHFFGLWRRSGALSFHPLDCELIFLSVLTELVGFFETDNFVRSPVLNF